VKSVKSNQLHDNFSKLQFSRISKITVKIKQMNQQFFILFCNLLVFNNFNASRICKNYANFNRKKQFQKNSLKFAHLQKQVTVSSMSIEITKFLPIFEAISPEMAEYLMAFVGPAWDELPDDLVTEVRKFEIMFDENIFFLASEKSHLKFKGRELKKPLEIDSEI
jgi:hypothetical protein